MFIRVKYGGDQTVLVNPNCIVKLIYEYLRVTTFIPEHYELDLMDESGNLVTIYNIESSACGLTIFEPRATYYVVFYERDRHGNLTYPFLQLSKNSRMFKFLEGRLAEEHPYIKDEHKSYASLGAIRKTYLWKNVFQKTRKSEDYYGRLESPDMERELNEPPVDVLIGEGKVEKGILKKNHFGRSKSGAVNGKRNGKEENIGNLGNIGLTDQHTKYVKLQTGEDDAKKGVGEPNNLVTDKNQDDIAKVDDLKDTAKPNGEAKTNQYTMNIENATESVTQRENGTENINNGENATENSMNRGHAAVSALSGQNAIEAMNRVNAAENVLGGGNAIDDTMNRGYVADSVTNRGNAIDDTMNKGYVADSVTNRGNAIDDTMNRGYVADSVPNRGNAIPGVNNRENATQNSINKQNGTAYAMDGANAAEKVLSSENVRENLTTRVNATESELIREYASSNLLHKDYATEKIINIENTVVKGDLKGKTGTDDERIKGAVSNVSETKKIGIHDPNIASTESGVSNANNINRKTAFEGGNEQLLRNEGVNVYKSEPIIGDNAKTYDYNETDYLKEVRETAVEISGGYSSTRAEMINISGRKLQNSGGNVTEIPNTESGIPKIGSDYLNKAKSNVGSELKTIWERKYHGAEVSGEDDHKFRSRSHSPSNPRYIVRTVPDTGDHEFPSFLPHSNDPKNKSEQMDSRSHRLGSGKGRYDELTRKNNKTTPTARFSGSRILKPKRLQKRKLGDDCVTRFDKAGNRVAVKRLSSLLELSRLDHPSQINDSDYLILLHPNMKFKQTHGTFL